MFELLIGVMALAFGVVLVGMAGYLCLCLLAAVLPPVDRAMHRLFDRIEARYPQLRRN